MRTAAVSLSAPRPLTVTASVTLPPDAAAQALMQQQQQKTRLVQLYAGSPRLLMFCNPNIDWTTSVAVCWHAHRTREQVGGVTRVPSPGAQKAKGVQLSYDLFRHSALDGIAHLFRENELLGARCVLCVSLLLPAPHVRGASNGDGLSLRA
jgi:hypothetical protein